ncbi:MAG: TRAP transporter small permease subunit [Thermodesulfobacteriota bacterium]
MGFLRNLDKALARLEGWLLVAFLGLMLILTSLQVILRSLSIYGRMHWANVLMGQIDWSEPAARLAVLWITFLGASLVTGENKHIRIDLVSFILPGRPLPFREILLSTASLIICGFMLKASLRYLSIEMSSGATLFLSLPTWAAQLILPAGFALLLFRFLVRGIEETLTLLKGVVR